MSSSGTTFSQSNSKPPYRIPQNRPDSSKGDDCRASVALPGMRHGFTFREASNIEATYDGTSGA